MIICCGEALFDVFVSGAANDIPMELRAHPGGSPFNVAIGLARLGGNAALLTGLSEDMLGARLHRILTEEKVSTDYLVRSGNRTTLSLVGVDGDGQPSYVFYGLGSADCSITPEDIPEIGSEVVGFHFGSYSLVVKPVADALSSLLTRTKGSFVSVDPNVRPTVEPDLDVWRERVDEYAAQATLLKVSAEDMAALYPGVVPDAKAEEWLSAGVQLVVVTAGGEHVAAWTSGGYFVRIAPPPTNVVDTVGAGDSFQAALLAKLSVDGDPLAAVRQLDTRMLEQLVEFAMTAAALTCRRRGANLPSRQEVAIELAGEGP